MSFTLQNDIAMPGRRNRYPFEQMVSGQSFEIVGADEARKVRNAAYQFAKKVNTEKQLKKGDAGHVGFALRKTDEHEVPGTDGAPATKVATYRLWRE
ncbi:MAG TPA: hypothetical protein VIY48_04325 [Candidatus Paceibacterota bacterium]